MLRSLARVFNVVPGHIEEDGLHRDSGELRRELDDVVQVDTTSGILVLCFNKRTLDGVCDAQLVVLAKSVNVHDGTVTLELAVEEVLKIFDVLSRNR